MKMAHISLYLILLLALSVTCYAQSNSKAQTEPKTKLESFQAKSGSVIVKAYSNIGAISGEYGSVEIDALELRDATSGIRVLGITINVKESGRLEREDISFVDYDEIDSLIKGIDYVVKIDNAAPLSNFEAIYRTKGDITITTFNRKNGSVSAAVTSGAIGQVRAFISLEELQKFRQVVIDAKTKLDSIRSK